MIKRPQHAFLALVFWLSAAVGFAELPEVRYSELPAISAAATPPLPTPDVFPVQLVLDDDSAEGALGIAGATARQFLWFQQFSDGPNDIDLAEIWVLFPNDAQIAPGAPIQIVVYQDNDADPTNGATLLLALDEVVQVADDATFSIYPLPAPLEIRGAANVLVGVVSRYVTSGATPPTQPAALDTTASAMHAWIATWSGDPPNPPQLPSDQAMLLVDDLIPGNWMIRAFGTPANVLDVPTLGGWGLMLLVSILTLAALRRL